MPDDNNDQPIDIFERLRLLLYAFAAAFIKSFNIVVIVITFVIVAIIAFFLFLFHLFPPDITP